MEAARLAVENDVDGTEEFLTVAEAAKVSRLGTSTVYRLLANGEMPGYKPKGQWLVERRELIRWIKSHRPRSKRDAMPKTTGTRGDSLLAEVVEMSKRR